MLEFFFGHVIQSTAHQYKLCMKERKIDGHIYCWDVLLGRDGKMTFSVANLCIKQRIIAVRNCCTNHPHMYPCAQYIIYHRYWS